MKINLGAIVRLIITAAAPILADKAADAIRKGADKIAKKKQA